MRLATAALVAGALFLMGALLGIGGSSLAPQDAPSSIDLAVISGSLANHDAGAPATAAPSDATATDSAGPFLAVGRSVTAMPLNGNAGTAGTAGIPGNAGAQNHGQTQGATTNGAPLAASTPVGGAVTMVPDLSFNVTPVQPPVTPAPVPTPTPTPSPTPLPSPTLPPLPLPTPLPSLTPTPTPTVIPSPSPSSPSLLKRLLDLM